MAHLVSIIIPCYNACEYIKETLDSIVNQDYKNLEIIIVDDGSTDQSKAIINSYQDNRLIYIYQINQGVSTARNYGFNLSKGEYVIFFDSDDIMSEEFISSRLRILTQNSDCNFVCGDVVKFSKKEIFKEKYKGAGENLHQEILLYDNDIITCPSNYLFKKDFLIKNGLNFNKILSSTADRFFLIQCRHKGVGMYSDKVSYLKYRVSPNSMSHLLSEKLVDDNEKFYNELISNGLIPADLKRKSLFLGYYILAGANWKIKKKLKSFHYVVKCFLTSPQRFVYKSFKKN